MNNINTVTLLGHYGDDAVIACSAWTSTSRNLTEDKIAKIPALLKMLAEKGHHTPFEKSSLHFLVTSDVASHIHKLKHRIGVSINGESARYKELKEDKFYLPEDWKDIKARSLTGAMAKHNGKDWYDILEIHSNISNELYHAALTDVSEVLGRKRAKESARYFKTYNTQTDCDIMFNWRSFHHFLSLRKKPDAQKEINDIADEMLTLVKNIEGNPFQHTIAAFGY
jgi:flavin-dependent thymidylate synthase